MVHYVTTKFWRSYLRHAVRDLKKLNCNSTEESCANATWALACSSDRTTTMIAPRLVRTPTLSIHRGGRQGLSYTVRPEIIRTCLQNLGLSLHNSGNIQEGAIYEWLHDTFLFYSWYGYSVKSDGETFIGDLTGLRYGEQGWNSMRSLIKRCLSQGHIFRISCMNPNFREGGK